MTLAFPRDMTTAYCWEEHRFSLMRRQELSRTAGGDTQAKDLGPALWTASFRSYPLLQEEAEALEADLQTLGGALRTFYAAPRRARPARDDGSASLSGVAVDAVGVDHDTLTLRGLPAHFQLRAGDYLSVTTSAGGRELHRLARDGVADGTGVTSDISIVPHVRPVVSSGDPVSLAPPLVEMRLSHDTLQSRRVTRFRWRVSFEATQVIR